ncbi:MAG: 2-dehydropantoate 2-reductase [Dehalococcoidia bacterium]|nr:2-dehydropantoate 2-reductase [Dehalococcoidia bacterium]
MKIVIVGAGAIGSGVGALLHQAGLDVTLVGRPAHVAAINQRGLIMDDVRPEARRKVALRIPAAERLTFTPDILVVATKAQDVAEACRESLPYARGVPAVMMQNGISGDAIAGDILGRENIIGCIVRFGMVYLEPGVIVRHSAGRLLIGQSFQPNGPVTRRVAETLNAGIQTKLTDNIVGARWTKLLYNVQAAVQAATGLSMQECGKRKDMVVLGMALVQETARVAEAAGVRLAPVEGIPLEAVAALEKLPPMTQQPDIPKELSQLCVFIGGHSPMSSTLQSRKRGKSTEVDFLNGDVVKAARAAGTSAPLNEAIVRLIHTLEKTGGYVTPEELWSVLVGERPAALSG